MGHLPRPNTLVRRLARPSKAMRRVTAAAITAICLGGCIDAVAQVTVSGPGSVGVGQMFGGTINVGVMQAELDAAIRARGAEQLKLLKDIARKLNIVLAERRGRPRMGPNDNAFSATIVHGFLATVRGKRIPEADWPRVFNELAGQYLESGARIAATPITSARIQTILAQAEEARRAGDLVKADQFLQTAEEQSMANARKLNQQLHQFNRQAASVLASRASLAFAQLDREKGAELLRRAFEQRADDVSAETLWWLFEASHAWEVLGDSRRALQLRNQGLRVAAREAEANPDSVDWRRTLSVSHGMVGDSQQLMGDLPAALGSYQNAMSVLQASVSVDPENSYRWWPDIAVTHERIGDVQAAQGYLVAALQSYEAGMAICLQLPDTVTSNPWWQRYRLLAHLKKGNLEVAKHDFDSALKSYQTSQAIAEALVATSPNETRWLSDLSATHNKLGDVLNLRGDPDAAVASFEAGKRITQKLALADPTNTELQGDLSSSYFRIGGSMEEQGDPSGAFGNYQTGLAIARKLKDADLTNAKWQLLVAGFCLQISGRPKPGVELRDQIEALGKCFAR